MTRRDCLALVAAPAMAQTRLAIGASGVGTATYQICGKLTELISKHLPGVSANTEGTAGVDNNLLLMSRGRVTLAFVSGHGARAAFAGTHRGLTKPLAVRALAASHSACIHVVVDARSGIRAIEDLRGKRIVIGSPGGGSDTAAQLFLGAYGLVLKDFLAVERLLPVEGAGALRDGRVDALVTWLAVPSPALRDLAATPGIQLRMIPSADAVSRVNEKHGPVFLSGHIPAGSYRGIDSAIPAAVSKTLLVAHESLGEDLAYGITRLFLEKRGELAMAHKAAAELNPKFAVAGVSIPFHPGAARYYREIGVL